MTRDILVYYRNRRRLHGRIIFIILSSTVVATFVKGVFAKCVILSALAGDVKDGNTPPPVWIFINGGKTTREIDGRRVRERITERAI